MSGVLTTSKWLKFFSEAGIPSNVAANYAVLFTDNRITTDMLLDLTKEYLYDMGIKVMGDVISILRYARTAYTKDAQEKIFQGTSSITQKSTRLELKRKENFDSPVKKFSRANVETKSVSSARVLCDSSDLDATQVSFQQPVPAGKRSVFHRLGENSVSSSTDLAKAKVQGHSVFHRLGNTSGGSLSLQPASSTVNDEDIVSVTKGIYKLGPPLQYRGILKPSPTVVSRVKKPITYNPPPVAEPKPNITEWIKPSLLQRKVSISALKAGQAHVMNRKPRLITGNTDPSLLFRRSLHEAEAQRRQDNLVYFKGPNIYANNVKRRLGTQEKTLTVRLPKSFSSPIKGQRIQSSNIVSLSKTMISDRNSEIQRQSRIALAKNASNRVILLNKSQAAASSNVFSRLGS